MSHKGSIFAIGDIHGCATELKELINKLPLTDDSEIVFLGDYVDRGPHSNEVIQTIIDLKQTHNVTALLGNHESMMIEFFKDPSSSLAGFFILNGGSATLASYVTHGNDYIVPDSHMEFLKELKLFHETEDYFFVHAGVPDVKLKQMVPEIYYNELLWIRHTFLESSFPWEKIIVHGHTPSVDVEIKKNRINLDTGCVFNGALSAIELPSNKIYQVQAKQEIPHIYLKEDPQISRVAKRFKGSIPVFIFRDGGYSQFQTLNYNEFGMLILEDTRSSNILEVGEILTGKIGHLSAHQIEFTGEVVRHQKRGHEIAYGVRMLEPLSKKM